MVRHQTPRAQAGLAKQACASCKVGKRRCTRELPTCSLCLRKNAKCQYAQSARGSPSSLAWSPRASRIHANERDVQVLSIQNLLFLDSRILQYGRPGPSGATAGHVMSLIGDEFDINKMSSHFFNTIQYWLPIISKKDFYEHHLRQSLPSRPDLALLLLCMKLITEVPCERGQILHTTTYQVAKQFYQEVEASGTLSFQVLQAGVLLALYEIGHAIHPSAFLSVGACARYAHALGLRGDIESQINRPLTWVEQEERRRVWWAIVVMDRYIGLGCRGRPFVTEHPQPYDILPSEEVAWDKGIIRADDLNTVSHPSKAQMSKFGLVAQAGRLLGQVLEHASTPITDPALHAEKFKQLDRTLRALMKAAEGADIPACDPLAVCLSALMVLHEPRATSKRQADGSASATYENNHIPTPVSVELSNSVAAVLQEKLPEITRNIERTSPWGTYSGYQAVAILTQLNSMSSTPERVQALRAVRETLRVYDTRWKLAGAYLQVLEAREVMNISG